MSDRKVTGHARRDLADTSAARSQSEQYHPVGPSGTSGSVVTIGQFFAILKRRAPVVLMAVLIGLLLSGALLLKTPKSYQSTAVLDISPTFGNNGSSSSSASSVSTITESRIATSTSVALAAKQTLGFAGTPTELAQKVTVSSPLASQVLNISFTSGTAQGAAEGANAFANAYLDYRRATAQKELTLRIARIQSQVADLQKSLAGLKPVASNTIVPQADSEQSLLQNQIQQLQNQLNTYQTSVVTPGQVAGSAAVPSAPSSPKAYLYLAGGLLLGLLVGIVAAIMRDRKDDRVRGSGDLEQSLSAPVIAETASAEAGSKPANASLAALTAARGAEADAYRTVTTTVTSDSAGSRVVMVCGTGLAGRSLVPLNLAATFAKQGLTTVIAGPRQALEQASELLDVQTIAAPGGPRLANRLAPSRLVAGLSVLSLGDEVELSATLRANGDNLDEVLTKVDMIVLDGINIELPSTSLRLGQIADEAVVVAYKNRSTHLDIERLTRHLVQVRATVLGGILLSRRSGLRARLHRHGTGTGTGMAGSAGRGTRDEAAGNSRTWNFEPVAASAEPATERTPDHTPEPATERVPEPAGEQARQDNGGREVAGAPSGGTLTGTASAAATADTASIRRS